MGKVQKVSILLNGGIDEQALSELAGPVPAQGASITLRASTNTRLSTRRGTCTRAPNALERGTLTHAVHGVMSCGAGKNVVVFSRPGQANTKVLSSALSSVAPGSGLLRGSLDPTAAQNPYIPTQITRAGAVPSVTSLCAPSVARDSNGYLWHAYAAPDVGVSTTDLRLTVTVTDADGAVIAAPGVIGTVTGSFKANIGITAHGQDVRLWYMTSLGIYMQPLLLSSNTVTSSAAIKVADIGRLADDMAVCSGAVFNADGSVDSTHAGFAYLVTSDSGTPNNGALYRIDTVTGASTKVTYAGAMDGGGYVAVCFSNTSSGYFVGAMFSCSPGGTRIVTTTPTLGASASDTKAADYGHCACQFLDTTPSGVALVALVNRIYSTWDSSDWTYTKLYTMPPAVSSATFRSYLQWLVQRSRGSQVRYSSTEVYPVFDLVRCYGSQNDDIFDKGYVIDPAIELWMVGSTTRAAPVARYGVPRFNMSPAHVNVLLNDLPVSGLCGFGPTVYTSYLQDIIDAKSRNAGQAVYPARFVELDFSPHQPPVAQDKDGVAFAATALPVQWDGTDVVEMGGPLNVPKLIRESSVTGSNDWTAGAYLLAAMYEWRDAAGLLHRSAPAVIQWDPAVAERPMLYAPPPNSLRRGNQQPIDTVFYATETNGDTLHRLPKLGSYGTSFAAAQITGGMAEAGRQALYSSGDIAEEQTPQPPPPAWDIAIVRDRCWILDGEVRSRIVYSKRRIAGVGYEFHPTYEILLPSGVGKTMAIREWGGVAVVFCENAIFAISGEGPDNLVGNPSGGSFAAPQRVAAVGTTSRESVLVTPKGILFQRDDDIMLFSGGEPTVIPGVQPETDVAGAALLRDFDEAVLFVGGKGKVWNYALGRWTTWTYDANVLHCHALAYDEGKVLLVAGAEDGPTLYRLDSDTPSTSSAMSWETDWLLGGGDFQDHVVLNRVLYSARRAGAHGITVEVFENYNETTPSKTAVFSATEITNGAVNGRYTLSVGPKRADTRATKIRITETPPMATLPFEGGEGTVPICLTLLFSVENLVHEASVPRQLVK